MLLSMDNRQERWLVLEDGTSQPEPSALEKRIPMFAFPLINYSFRRARMVLPVFLTVLAFLLAGCASGTAISQPQTTTPTIAPTSTLMPTATPIPNPYPPYTGTLVWDDPLTESGQGHQWSDGGPCQFSGEGYQVVQQPNYGGTCFETATTFSNFALQVTMTFLQHSSAYDGGGITFRADPNNLNNHYELDLYASGKYYLAICAGYDCSRVVFQGKCDNCHFDPAQPNTLAMVANGNSVTFFANGQQLASGTDATYSQGVIGFFGVAFSSPSTMLYQNLKVWQW
jgi:hypothetical protein